MPTVNFSLTTAALDTTSSVIAEDHFGSNMSAFYQNFGDQPWEKLDEIVNAAEFKNLRYPGGQSTETYFDITNPDYEGPVGDPNGNDQIQIGQLRFLEFCSDNDIRPIIVLPVENGVGTVLVDGHLDVDPTWPAKVTTYITKLLTDAYAQVPPVTIESIELGNEYAPLDSTTYGRLASAAAEAAQDAIDAWAIANSLGAGWDEPDILVQAWNQRVQDGATVIVLDVRNQTVIDQFSTDALDAIDGVVQHYYFGSEREVNAGYDSYADIATAYALSDSMIDLWETATDRDDLSLAMSEWNVNHQLFTRLDEANDILMIGLQQVAPMMEMISLFLKDGFDSLQIWSMQYNNNSTYDGENPTIAGAAFQIMKADLIGMQVLDLGTSGGSTDVVLHGFESTSGSVIYVNSYSKTSQTVMFSFDDIFPGFEDYATITGLQYTLDTTEADGEFQNIQDTLGRDLEIYEEADLSLLTSTLTQNPDGTYSFTLDAFEFASITLDYGNKDFMRMADSDPNFTGTGNQDIIIGTSVADTIDGGSNADFIYSGAGNDIVTGGNGQDYVELGDGNDIFHDNSQLKTDTIYGGDGNDTINGDAGDDIFYGDTGFDTIEGGDGSDTIYGGSNADVINAGKGGDTVWGDNGKDTVDLGNGNDFFYDNTQSGVSGADTINGGSGKDDISLGGGDDIVTGGSEADKFRFYANTDHDVITDFETIDKLRFDDALWGGGSQSATDFAQLNGAGDVEFYFDANNSVTLVGYTDLAFIQTSADIISF